MTLQLLVLVLGIGILYFGAESLVRGAARLAHDLGVSPIVVGLTVVSLGTSAPEMVVCVLATLEGRGGLAMGNILGSNLANLGLVLGIAALIMPLRLAGRVVVREVPIMLAVTLLVLPMLLDGQVGRTDGILLLLILVLYLFFIGWTAEEEILVLEEYREFVQAEAEDKGTRSARTPLQDFGLLTVGCFGVILGGHLIVTGARSLALDLGISEMVIGLTMVAVGTSLPELATTVVATVRKESDIAVGNVIGSNIFNLTAVLGVSGVIGPIQVPPSVLSVEYPAVLGISVLILIIALSSRKIHRWGGAVLLGAYASIGFWVFL